MSFDMQLSMELKERGMKKAAMPRKQLLMEARRIARRIGVDHGCCDVDDVARAMEAEGLDYSALGNAAGSIFASKAWVFNGEYVKSSRVSAHARDIKVWHFTGQDE